MTTQTNNEIETQVEDIEFLFFQTNARWLDAQRAQMRRQLPTFGTKRIELIAERVKKCGNYQVREPALVELRAAWKTANRAGIR